MASAHFASPRLTVPAGRLARRQTWLVAAVPLAVLAVLLAWPAVLFKDGDTGWHLGAGDYIWRTGTIPATDPFSTTFLGHAWTAHEWLSEVMMSAAFDRAGWSGLATFFALVAGGALLLIGDDLRRSLPARWAAVGVLVVAFTGVPLALARPHLLGWALFAGWLIILLRARDARRAPPWAALLLMAAWANIHASYILGLGVAGVITVEALVDHRREPRMAARWAAWGLLAIAATAITPHGLQGFLYPLQVQDMKLLAIIEEWRPSDLRDAPFLLYAGLFWLFVAARWRQVPPLRALLLAGLFAMALMHVRHQMLFAIAAALIGARLVGRPEDWEGQAPGWRSVLPLMAVMATVRLMVPWTLPDTPVYPLALIERVPASLRIRPVFNDYSMGGPLIMKGIRPVIDGRADMYGDDFTFAHLAMQRGDLSRFEAFARRWDVRWTILTRDSPLAARLDHARGWRRLASDDKAVVHVRTP